MRNTLRVRLIFRGFVLAPRENTSAHPSASPPARSPMNVTMSTSVTGGRWKGTWMIFSR